MSVSGILREETGSIRNGLCHESCTLCQNETHLQIDDLSYPRYSPEQSGLARPF